MSTGTARLVSTAVAPFWRNRIVDHREVDPRQVVPHERNWRTHPAVQMKALAGVLDEFGWARSLVVNRRTGRLLDGHARLALALSREEPLVPVEFVDVDEAEERVLLATLDPISAMVETDPEKLAALLGTAKANGEALRAMLQDLGAKAAVELGRRAGRTDPNAVPAVPKKPRTRPGDLWAMGPHRLYCGDSTKRESFDVLMGGERARLVWTDPPYNVDYQGKTGEALRIECDDLPEEGFRELLRNALGNAAAFSAPGASWYVAAPAGPSHHVFGEVLHDLKIWHQTLIWRKDRFVLGHSDYHYAHEPLFYGWVPGAPHYFTPDRTQDSVLEFPRPARSEDHPTTKPVGLVARCVENSSRPGWTVLDPFAGSGTTLLACEQIGRVARLVEIDPRYADVVVRRWEEFTGGKATREETA